jgi:hypothetical protein
LGKLWAVRKDEIGKKATTFAPQSVAYILWQKAASQKRGIGEEANVSSIGCPVGLIAIMAQSRVWCPARDSGLAAIDLE